METVVLKNGAEEKMSLVQITMMSLRSLLQEKPIVFYELVMKCRNRNHQFFGGSGDDLKAFSLVQSDDSVHDSIRNIVLSSVTGDGLKMTLSSPVGQ